MTRKQAGWMALAKRLLGWIIFIPALISTLISLMKYIEHYPGSQDAMNAVMLDFAHVVIDMLQVNTPFLQFFWDHAPLPDFHRQMNLLFWIIYALMFVALALHASGLRMSRRVRFLREYLQDQMIIEQAKGEQGISRQQLESKLTVPDHSLFRQFFLLYILPVLLIIIGYFALSLANLL